MLDETNSRSNRKAGVVQADSGALRASLIVVFACGCGMSVVSGEGRGGMTYFLESGAIHKMSSEQKANVRDAVFVGDNEGYVAANNTDASALPTLPNLKSVCLSGSQITDASLIHLAQCSSLSDMDLSYCTF